MDATVTPGRGHTVSGPRARTTRANAHTGSRPAAVNRAASTGNEGAPAPVTIFLVLAVMFPVEAGISIGSLSFTWSKAYLLAMSFVVLPAVLRMKLHLFDVLWIAHVLWTFLAYLIGYGISQGLQAGGTYAIEMMTVYFLVRLYVRSFDQVVDLIKVLFWLALISTILGIPEAFIEKRYIHEFAKSVTGTGYTFYNENRLGLLRAAAAFEHPILFGMFCAALLSPIWFTARGATRIAKVAVIATGTFFSLSSAPLLLFVAQIALIAVERTTRWLRHRVMIFSSALLAVVVFLEVASGRGAIGWLTMIMLNPATAWYRKAQIDYSMDDIGRHPLFGIGSQTWTRPIWLNESIDNHFIAVAIRSGLPSLILFAATFFMLWRALAQVDASQQPAIFAQLRKGWGLMTAALLFGAATVTFFGTMQPLLAFYLGLGASLVGTAQTTSEPTPGQHKGRSLPTGRRQRQTGPQPEPVPASHLSSPQAGNGLRKPRKHITHRRTVPHR